MTQLVALGTRDPLVGLASPVPQAALVPRRGFRHLHGTHAVGSVTSRDPRRGFRHPHGTHGIFEVSFSGVVLILGTHGIFEVSFSGVVLAYGPRFLVF